MFRTIFRVHFIGGNVSVRMPYKTPFFSGMNRMLFGRPPVAVLERLSRARGEVERLCLSQFQLLFGAFIPAALIDFRTGTGANSRRRVFSPGVTFWAFLGQVLDPGASCRKALTRVQVLFASQELAAPSNATVAYCNARRRLPVQRHRPDRCPTMPLSPRRVYRPKKMKVAKANSRQTLIKLY